MTAIDHRSPVSWRLHEGLFVITIDEAPVNALSATVRSGLLDALSSAGAAGGDVSGLVLVAAGRHFIAGSDLREFEGPIPSPELPTVLAAFDACRWPIAALLHGATLGGGLELALTCDLRVAAADSRLGLPEVTLGMLPGAGGTQRLPRLVGRAAALEMVTSGRQVDAVEALGIGLVDEVLSVDADPLVAVALALRALPGRRRLRDLPVPEDDPRLLDEALSRAGARAKQYPQVPRIIELICTSSPIDQALDEERAAFHELRSSPQAAARRYAALSERSASHSRNGAEGRDVDEVAVVGAGTMGRSIALACALAGLPTGLTDADAGVLRAAERQFTETLSDRVGRGRMSSEEADQVLARVRFDGASVESADFVIEAVVEDVTVKQQVLTHLANTCGQRVVIASNTSYLDIDELAAPSGLAAQIVGLHFFHPANVMKLVEVVPGGSTAPETVSTAFRLAKRLGKIAVLAGNREGFIGNRMYAAYRDQAEALLLHGCRPAEVDEAMRAFGFPMGPFQVADSSGLDIAWARRRRRRAAGALSGSTTIADQLCELGRFGVKSGAGWYTYSAGPRAPMSDPIVDELIFEASGRAGAPREGFDAEKIQHALLGAILGAAADVVADGVSRRPEDIDVVWLHGYGFPRWWGGPVFWGRRRDPAALLADVRAASRRTGTVIDSGTLEQMLYGSGG